MLPSQKIGSFPWLSIWNWKLWQVFLFTVAVDFGVINLLFAAEGHFFRGRYRSFIINDTLVIPLYLTAVTLILRTAPSSSAWHTDQWWHWVALVAPLLLSVGLEADSVRKGLFTLSQEMSPSKLYHTLIFAVVGYWMLSPLPAVIAAHRPAPVFVGIVGLLIVWLFVVFVLDATYRPHDAHLEWNWRTLSGQIRQYP